MASLSKRLMRIGEAEEPLSPAMRSLIARLRADVGRFTAGQDASGRVRIVEEEIVVEIRGRMAGCVARQIERRVPEAMCVSVEEGADWRLIKIGEVSDEST